MAYTKGPHHHLGVGGGTITDKGDGTMEYRPAFSLRTAFRVRIADITGFSVRKASKVDRRNGAAWNDRVLVIHGSGTDLASCAVAYSAAQDIENWVRAHPTFRGNVPQDSPIADHGRSASVNLADELAKLAQLRESGVLSPTEFEQAKAKLLG